MPAGALQLRLQTQPHDRQFCRKRGRGWRLCFLTWMSPPSSFSYNGDVDNPSRKSNMARNKLLTALVGKQDDHQYQAISSNEAGGSQDPESTPRRPSLQRRPTTVIVTDIKRRLFIVTTAIVVVVLLIYLIVV